MKSVEFYLDQLGREATDKVTGFNGIVTSIGFDLYGCIQAIVTPKSKKDGDLIDSRWFDIDRLNIKGRPVMKNPSFRLLRSSQDEDFDPKGPQEKSIPKF